MTKNTASGVFVPGKNFHVSLTFGNMATGRQHLGRFLPNSQILD